LAKACSLVSIRRVYKHKLNVERKAMKRPRISIDIPLSLKYRIEKVIPRYYRKRLFTLMLHDLLNQAQAKGALRVILKLEEKLKLEEELKEGVEK